ncbi:MAG TPA: TolC family protein [Bryobacteraceae bacterium]|nr:TolC family protein [Bryobacteraceae bacterium]
MALVAFDPVAWAQAGVSAARQVPISGREGQPGAVNASQSTTAAPAESPLTIRGSISVQGAYAGSVPSGSATGTILPLRLDDALRLALRQNLAAVSDVQTVRQAEGLRRSVRSALLPEANTVVSETVEQLNLRTAGVEESAFPLAVGPFNFFDARAARVTQAVFDLVRWRNLRTASENLNAAELAARDARDLVVLAVAGSYLEIIATNARIVAADGQVRSSQAIYQQAVDRLKEGLNARIDTTRTEVQLQIDRQRLRSLQADRDRQKLQLARLIGLPLGQDFSIANDFPYAPYRQTTLAAALVRAYQTRADLQSAQAAVRAADSAVKAAHAERLPDLTLAADYGAAGLRPDASAHGVFSVSGTLTIPLYQGGRVRGDVEQAEAALRQRQAELDDVRGRVDQDVRQAFIDMNAAADEVAVAGSNVSLADDTLQQARDRFAGGVADTVEVVQAQQSVIAAHDDYIIAVFDHNLAKVSLARAMGNAEQSIGQFLVSK